MNSFVRQLNMYGFHKSRKETTKSVFYHPDFIKGRSDLLGLIKRKVRPSQNELQVQQTCPSNNEIKDIVQELTTHQNTPEKLKTEQEPE